MKRKPKKVKEKKFVKIELSVPVRQDEDCKDIFNPVYMQMTDEGLV